MSKYTISCTQEQIEKSLKLGAEEEFLTAEEMIGWLETQGIISIEVEHDFEGWYYVDYIPYSHIGDFENKYDSRKEATISAIDAALEYLIQKQ